MKKLKLIMLFCISGLLPVSESFGQANPFINVLPSNSGIVTVGGTIDIVVTVGNTGPVSAIPQAKLRPIIQVPTSVQFLPNAQQTGLPSGWSILSNSGTQLRVCNSSDPIAVNSSRTIVLKAQGVSVAPAQTFSGNINFGNGTTCASGPSVTGDLIADNSATSTIKVEGPVTLNLKVYIAGFWDGAGAMLPVLSNQGQSNPTTDCDSITVELHNVNSPYNTLFGTVAVLHTDGTASAVFAPNVTTGNYYIAIKHRNSMETWSANPVTIGTTTSYDFSTAANKAYGDNQVEVSTGVFAIYNGDLNQDLAIDGFDYILMDPVIVAGSSGYLTSDVNGDGSVDAFDFLVVSPNIDAGITIQAP